MSEFIEIRWVCGSIDEARKISRYLVQERLVASAKIIPWLEAISMLNNQLETSQESQVCFITKHSLFEKVLRVIQENSSYQVPEITFTSIEGGNSSYLDWTRESVRDYSNIPN